MADGVGTDPLECTEGETVSWEFTVEDSTGNITTLAGQTILGVLKATAGSPDPPLIGPVTCSITGTMKFKFQAQIALDPGSYVFGARREEAGPTVVWQYVNAPVTVTDSPNQD